MLAQTHSAHSVLFHNQLLYGMICEHVCAIEPCIDHIGRSETEGVDSTVGHRHSSYYVGIDRRLHALGFGGVDGFGGNTCRTAGLYKQPLIIKVILGKRDKEASCRLHAVARNPPQYHVLLYALGGRLAVGHGIACAAVQKSVVAPGSACGEVVALHQERTQSAEGAVARGAGSGSSGADNHHIVFIQ